MKRLSIFVDGAVSGTRHAGAAAVAQTKEGYFIGWLSRQFPSMSNNEAEYQAALLGLALARQLNVQTVEIVSDSEVVVRQMTGQSRVLSKRLRQLHQETCATVGEFTAVSFRHVRRGHNCLADALAAEALAGQVVQMRSNHSPIKSLRWLR
ncbi:MAG: reverse transcriptase-like protein [Chloroflexi bacterium]|nr:reverse transcriptase-like protein [Chloroflexota bacterium]